MTNGPPASASGEKRDDGAGDAFVGHSLSEPYEVVRGQIPEDLLEELVCPFTENCRHELFRLCGLTRAEGVPRPQRPKALWIFGPPAVGKSSMADKACSELFGAPGNAVVVDGDDMRVVHEGFQKVAEHGFRNHVVHADAWEIFKKAKLTEALKKEVMRTAMESRQNLLIPDAAVCLERSLGMLRELAEAGYDLHAVCMWAPEAQTLARGTARAARTGKVFNPKSYWPAIDGALEMGRHWHRMIEEGCECYKAVSFYDNTTLPSRPVGLEHFELLTHAAQSRFPGSTCMVPFGAERCQADLCDSDAPSCGADAAPSDFPFWTEDLAKTGAPSCGDHAAPSDFPFMTREAPHSAAEAAAAETSQGALDHASMQALYQRLRCRRRSACSGVARISRIRSCSRVSSCSQSWPVSMQRAPLPRRGWKAFC